MARIGLTSDRKFRRLARALDDVQVGFGELLARGALELLWDAAYEAADDYIGDGVDVEAAAKWRGKDGVLLASLLNAGGEGNAGFIDEGGSEWWPEGKVGIFRVHDLWDHAPDFVAKRASREAEREAKGETLSSIRSAAGKTGRARQLSGKRQADDGQTADIGQPVARADRASGGQKSSLPRPAPPRPAPGRPGQPTDNDRLAGEPDGRLGWLRSELAVRLGLPKMLGIGRDPDRVVASFERVLAAWGDEAVLADCLSIASDKGETPSNLAWWSGWFDTVPDGRLARYVAQKAEARQ